MTALGAIALALARNGVMLEALDGEWRCLLADASAQTCRIGECGADTEHLVVAILLYVWSDIIVEARVLSGRVTRITQMSPTATAALSICKTKALPVMIGQCTKMCMAMIGVISGVGAHCGMALLDGRAASCWSTEYLPATSYFLSLFTLGSKSHFVLYTIDVNLF